METLIKRINGDTCSKSHGHAYTIARALVLWLSAGECPSGGGCLAGRGKDRQTGKQAEAALRALLNSAGVTDQDPALLQFKDAFGRAWDGFLLALNR